MNLKLITLILLLIQLFNNNSNILFAQTNSNSNVQSSNLQNSNVQNTKANELVQKNSNTFLGLKYSMLSGFGASIQYNPNSLLGIEFTTSTIGYDIANQEVTFNFVDKNTYVFYTLGTQANFNFINNSNLRFYFLAGIGLWAEEDNLDQKFQNQIKTGYGLGLDIKTSEDVKFVIEVYNVNSFVKEKNLQTYYNGSDQYSEFKYKNYHKSGFGFGLALYYSF